MKETKYMLVVQLLWKPTDDLEEDLMMLIESIKYYSNEHLMTLTSSTIYSDEIM